MERITIKSWPAPAASENGSARTFTTSADDLTFGTARDCALVIGWSDFEQPVKRKRVIESTLKKTRLGQEPRNEPASPATEFSPGQAQRNEVERSAALGTVSKRFVEPASADERIGFIFCRPLKESVGEKRFVVDRLGHAERFNVDLFRSMYQTD